jgi:NAD+ kinase
VKARVTVVLKRSSWRKWVEEEKDARVTELVASGDDTVQRMRPSHEEHTATVEEVRRALGELDVDVTTCDEPHGFRVQTRCDLVITVGGDGTLLAASHGIGIGTPLLGINSAPTHSVGFFCAAHKGQAKEAIVGALEGALRRTELTRMRVERNGRVLHERVLNEALFCHASPAATSRYILVVAGGHDEVVDSEEQKSSGVWVGPAAGSTAAQKSAGGKVLPLGSHKLQYVVREPYCPHALAERAFARSADGPHARPESELGQPVAAASDELRMSVGLVDEDQTLHIKSKMRQARIFLDGDHIVHEVTIGDVVTMRRSDESLVVLGLSRNGSGGSTGRPGASG